MLTMHHRSWSTEMILLPSSLACLWSPPFILPFLLSFSSFLLTTADQLWGFNGERWAWTKAQTQTLHYAFKSSIWLMHTYFYVLIWNDKLALGRFELVSPPPSISYNSLPYYSPCSSWIFSVQVIWSPRKGLFPLSQVKKCLDPTLSTPT